MRIMIYYNFTYIHSLYIVYIVCIVKCVYRLTYIIKIGVGQIEVDIRQKSVDIG